jgi:hypothetical protein
LGCCLWFAAVLMSAFAPSGLHDVYGLSMPVSMTVLAIVVLAAWLVIVRRHLLTQTGYTTLLLSLTSVMLLYWLFTSLKIVIMTGDSLKHVHPQWGLIPSMQKARAFDQALSYLARDIVGDDRYFFAIHPLFGLSLCLLVAESVFCATKHYSGKTMEAIVSAMIAVLVLVSPHMTAIQFFYVNHHMLVAFLILFSWSLLEEGLNADGVAYSRGLAFLGAIAAAFLSVLRIEGQIVAALLMLIMCGRTWEDSKLRFYVYVLYASLTAPVMWIMMRLWSEGGRVDGSFFTYMLLLNLCVSVFFALERPRFVVSLQNQFSHWALIASVFLVAATFFLRSERMAMLPTIFDNALDESYWGFVHYIIPAMILVVWISRILGSDRKHLGSGMECDRLLWIYLSGLLVIIFITIFQHTRPGWSGTHNRMLFHFYPVIIVWLSIQAGRMISGALRAKAV